MNKITIFLSSVISLLVIPAISLCQNPVDIIKEFNEVTLSLKELLKDDNLKNSSTGFYAIDVNTGEILVEFNPDLSMVPASVQKIITTAAALEILGKNFRFCTTLEYDGEIDENGTLNGNIFIRGGGDPALGSDRFKKHYFEPSFWDRWCDSIKRLGIKKINGSVIGDAGIFDEEVTPPTWAWGDIGNYYGASPSGLSVYENMYSIFLNSGPKAGDTTEIAGIEPEIPGLCFENYVKSADVKDDEAFIYGAVYTNVCRIRGSIPKGQKRFEIKGSIPDPAFFAAFELDKYLKEKGISVSQSPTTIRILRSQGKIMGNKRKTISTLYSPSLKYLVDLTNKYSINLYAEHFLYQLGKQKFPQGGVFEGAKAVEAFLQSIGIDTKGLFINDGSGLSRYNSITVKQITDLLKYMQVKSSCSDEFVNSLSVAGINGTLKKFFKGTAAENNLRGKTGSMTRVRGCAGYVTTKSKRKLAFAVIINNYSYEETEIDKIIERLLVKLAELNI